MHVGNLKSVSIRFGLNQRRWIKILDEIAFSNRLSLSVSYFHLDEF